jgi:hypothetical protein
MRTRSVLLAVLSLILFSAAVAGPAIAGPAGKKMAARHMIRRTAVVIRAAHRQVREHKVYTGDLARAVAHQKFARRLFGDGEYVRAMHQTRWARALAVRAIVANKGAEPPEAALTPEEMSETANGPSEEQLTGELKAAMPSEPEKDEALININLDLDVK